MDTVKIKLNEYQEAILKKEFKSCNGIIKLNRDTAIGKFITSQVQWVKDAPYQPVNGVTLGLPRYHFIFQQNFYPYISIQCQKNIRDFLQASFDINIELFFIKGYRHGFKQKDIIDAFMYYYQLPFTLKVFEMIKQRDFRKRRNVKKIIAEFIAKN